jgi:HTH-type transcriptional regulator, global nitrogen regulator NrpRI
MKDRVEKKRLAILRVLQASRGPLSSQKITEILNTSGVDISERTVRFHLQYLDQEGLTRYMDRQGRIITELGKDEVDNARAFERVGFLADRIDQMSYAMDFDLKTHTGKVVVNISFIERSQLKMACPLMYRVYEAGYAMGTMITLLSPGEYVGDMMVPEGWVGIGTVCSITVNGILLSQGVPIHSRFGGLLELQDREPTRFVAIIKYDGTSLDPLEIFIRSGMTDYSGATATGSGLIGASFREFPAEAKELVEEIEDEMRTIGLGCIMEIGMPGQPLMEVPVSWGNVGAIIIGGLNPVAILEEHGMKVRSKALSGLLDFDRLFPYTELDERASSFI